MQSAMLKISIIRKCTRSVRILFERLIKGDREAKGEAIIRAFLSSKNVKNELVNRDKKN